LKTKPPTSGGICFGMKTKKKKKTLEDQAKHLLLLGMQKNT